VARAARRNSKQIMMTKILSQPPKKTHLVSQPSCAKIILKRLIKTNDNELEEEVFRLNAKERRNVAEKFESWANQLRQTADLLDGRLIVINRN
jgi:hypothetical protein